MHDYTPGIDVAAVRDKARRQWEKQQRRNISISEYIGRSVPWWLVAVALVFFVLSAPHTARVFGTLTPTFGYVAPVGVEFGLLYAAFRRKQSRAAQLSIPWTLWALEILLFITAIVVNGAGSLQAVVDGNKSIEGMSIKSLVEEFGNLPATSQVALALVPIAALIIPIGTSVAGEGLATLFLERREMKDDLDTEWRDVAAEVEYYALRDVALARGINPRKANHWAASITGFGLSEVSTGQQRTAERTDSAPVERSAGQGYTKQMDARQKFITYIEAHPNEAGLSVRRLAELSGVGKSTVSDVLQSMRVSAPSNNGHDRNGDGA